VANFTLPSDIGECGHVAPNIDANEFACDSFQQVDTGSTIVDGVRGLLD
jgi:hypothetical protein